MRTWKALLIVGVVAALAGLTLAHDEDSSSRSRVQILHMDQDGDHHQRSWVFDEDRGFLGVHLGRDENGRGARITTVLEDSAAEEAGLRDGDVITGLNGEEIRNPGDLTRAMRGLEPGDEVELEILRDGRGENLAVELGEHPRSFSFAFGDEEDGPFGFSFDMDDLDGHLADLHERLQDLDFGDFGGSFVMDLDDFGGSNMMHFGHGRPRLGVQVIQPTAELRQHLGSTEDLGILVGKVLPGTVAEEAGVQVGDLIVAVDDDEIADAGDLTRALERRAGRDITLELVRDGRTVRLDATLAADEDEDDTFRGPAQRMRQPLKQTSPAQKT
jgi:S1-C subfamily serine protease